LVLAMAAPTEPDGRLVTLTTQLYVARENQKKTYTEPVGRGDHI
jgi:hypothetical protein